MRHVPVWTVVLALVAVPTLTMLMFGTAQVRSTSDTVAAADQARSLTGLFVALADLRAALVDEQILVSAGIVRDQLDLPEDLVESVTGLNMAETAASTVERARAALERALAGPVDTIRVDGARILGDALRRLDDLAQLRGRVDAEGLDFGRANLRYSAYRNEISSALGAVNRVLNDVTDRVANPGALRDLIAATRVTLDATESMSLELLALSSSIVQGLTESQPNPLAVAVPGNIALSADRRRIEVADIGALLTGPLLTRWKEIRAHGAVRGFEHAIAALASGDPAAAASLDDTSVARQGLTRLRLHTAFIAELGAALSREVDRVGREAAHDRTASVAVLVAIVALTALLAGAAAAAITRPLGRLHDRAIALRDGDLDASIGEPRGPHEVYEVGRAFHEVVQSLRAVERRARAMIAGTPTDEEEIVGPLGRSVQQSIQRLGEVTDRLKVSEAVSKAIVATAAEAIWTLGADGTVRTANTAAQQLTGLPLGAMVGRPFESLLDRPVLDPVVDRGSGVDGESGAGGRTELRGVEAALRRPDGTLVPALLSMARVDLDGQSILTVFARDITERKQFEERLEAHAATDPLTALPNRRAAIEAIDAGLVRAARSGEGVAVIFCDLDRFKQANDTYGHAFGDHLLRQTAERFRRVTRQNEVLARLGGDEFVVVMVSDHLPRDAMLLAHRLLGCLEDRFVLGDAEAQLSGSIGIAWGGAESDALDLLRNADVAMYRAKAQGGSTALLYDTGLQEEARARIDIERGLRTAIERGDLELYFQPIIDLRGQTLVGAEALLRWNRPGEGLLLPGRFIPIAEDAGTLVVELGRWVLHAAARQVAEWDRLGVHQGVPVSVNISGIHLTRHDLVGDVVTAFGAAGVATSRLRIELTESQLISELESAAAALRRLADIGVRVAIDDYGTGYSSITYLRRLPVDAIKIDRSFITQLHQPNLRAIVESLTTLGSLLGLEVVAEGVEHPEQLRTVIDLGCTAAQGFHISVPLPSAEFTAWRLPDRAGPGGAIVG